MTVLWRLPKFAMNKSLQCNNEIQDSVERPGHPASCQLPRPLGEHEVVGRGDAAPLLAALAGIHAALLDHGAGRENRGEREANCPESGASSRSWRDRPLVSRPVLRRWGGACKLMEDVGLRCAQPNLRSLPKLRSRSRGSTDCCYGRSRMCRAASRGCVDLVPVNGRG